MSIVGRGRIERAADQPLFASRAGAAVLLGLAVFGACLFGIYTRPIGFLAAVWPANAIMLGMLIRVPNSANMLGWACATIAYLFADLLTGSSPLKALILNSANLLGVATAYLICQRFPTDVLRFRTPVAMLYIVVASAAAGAMAGVVGGLANPVLFDRSAMSGLVFWFVTELVNYVLILPVILSAPPLSAFVERRNIAPSIKRTHVLPIVALALSGLTAVLIGGPGAIAFPVPALLWCGLVYRTFPTAILTLAFGVWTLGIISAGYIPNPTQAESEMMLVSVRLGASLIALAPVMLASVMAHRNELLDKMRHLATHDPLTGAVSRSAFLEHSTQILHEGQGSLAVLMIDLDHFKAVNDRFGHATGDRILVVFAKRAAACLRPDDVFGRLGGEEFAATIDNCGEAEAIGIANRIRAAASEPIPVDDGESLTITVSVGLTIVHDRDNSAIEPILSEADRLLYLAKTRGRNRVEVSVQPRRLPD